MILALFFQILHFYVDYFLLPDPSTKRCIDTGAALLIVSCLRNKSSMSVVRVCNCRHPQFVCAIAVNLLLMIPIHSNRAYEYSPGIVFFS